MLTINLKYIKDTPGTYRYQEIDEKGNVISNSRDCIVGSLYLRKDKIENPPKIITITIRGV